MPSIFPEAQDDASVPIATNTAQQPPTEEKEQKTPHEEVASDQVSKYAILNSTLIFPKAAEEAVVAQAAAAEDKVVDLVVFSSFD